MNITIIGSGFAALTAVQRVRAQRSDAKIYSGPQSQDKKYYEFKMVSFSTAEQRCPVSSFKSVTFDLP